MGFKIITANDPLEVGGILKVLYGEPGIGKTSFCFTADKPLLMDFDKGVKRSVGRKDFLQVDRWEDVISFLNSEDFKVLDVKTIIIDTGATMLDNFIAQYVIRQDIKNARNGGELSLQGYGAMKGVFRQFVNMVKSQGKDIVVVCHSESMKEGDNIKFIPRMTGGSYDILIAEADMVGYMESRNNQRTIQFNPTDRNIGKNTAEFNLIQVPHYTSPEYASFCAELITKTKAKMLALTEEQNQALKVIDEIRTKLDATNEITAVEKMLPEIEQQPRAIQASLYGMTDKKYNDLLKEELAKISSPEEADQYFAGLHSYPERYKSTFKTLLWEQAKKAGLDFDKEASKFTKKEEPETPAAETKKKSTKKTKDEAVSVAQ